MANPAFDLARKTTWADLGRGRGCALEVGGGLCGALFGNLVSGALGAALGALLGTVVPIFAVFLFNWIRADGNIARGEADKLKRERDEARAALAMATGDSGEALERDMTIAELARYIRPDITSDSNDAVKRVVTETIFQAVQDNKLRLYGRPSQFNMRAVYERSGRPSFVEIPKHRLYNGWLTFDFLKPNSDLSGHISFRDAELPHQYADVHVNRAQVLRNIRRGIAEASTNGEWQNGWFVYKEPRPLITSQMSHDEANLDRRSFVADVAPGATLRYEVETTPKVTTWSIWLGQNREEEERKLDVNKWTTAKLDDQGYINLFVTPTAGPPTINMRVRLLSWRMPDAD